MAPEGDGMSGGAVCLDFDGAPFSDGCAKAHKLEPRPVAPLAEATCKLCLRAYEADCRRGIEESEAKVGKYREWIETTPNPAPDSLAEWKAKAKQEEGWAAEARRDADRAAARLAELDGAADVAAIREAVAQPRRPQRRHLSVVEHRGLTLNRQPGLLALAGAVLEAVEVDGEPYATRSVDRPIPLRVAEPVQGSLFGGPRTLGGRATAGALIETVADVVMYADTRAWNYGLPADGRSPLRADVLKLGAVAYALSGTVRLTDGEGARLVGGADTEANRARFKRALQIARLLRLTLPGKKPWDFPTLVDAETGPPGGPHRLGPPRWWVDAMMARAERRKLKGAKRKAHKLPDGPPVAWRLSGGLFRPASKWGTLERVIGGIEAALTWGPSAGGGRGGRLPDLARPVRKGGPGPPVFVTAWEVFRLAGEAVAPGPLPGRYRERWRALIAALRARGYMTEARATASAGDTIEVLEVRKGGRGHPAGIVVRASARFCAALATGWKGRVKLPATRLIDR